MTIFKGLKIIREINKAGWPYSYDELRHFYEPRYNQNRYWIIKRDIRGGIENIYVGNVLLLIFLLIFKKRILNAKFKSI